MLDHAVCLKIHGVDGWRLILSIGYGCLIVAISGVASIPLHADEVGGDLRKHAPQNKPDRSLSSPAPSSALKAERTTHLPNLVHVRASAYSGGTPVGQKGFAALQSLGIETLVSVDGAKPRIDLASRFGIRSIHIPIGYDGITDSQKSTLRAVFTQCRPPYYFHCHHGKHRGPAALAAALCAAGKMTLAQANDYLKLAGTSRRYKGLWNAVADASKSPPLPAPQPLTPVTSVSSMVAVMTAIAPIYDNLKSLKKNNWQADPDQPDVTPTHQSLMLLEQLKELPRTIASDQVKKPLFLNALNATTQHASQLQRDLRKLDWDSASKSFKKIRVSCVDCHVDFRD